MFNLFGFAVPIAKGDLTIFAGDDVFFQDYTFVEVAPQIE